MSSHQVEVDKPPLGRRRKLVAQPPPLEDGTTLTPNYPPFSELQTNAEQPFLPSQLPYATNNEPLITQPRLTSSRDQNSNSANWADTGRVNKPSHPHFSPPTINTGPPPGPIFQQQKQFSPLPGTTRQTLAARPGTSRQTWATQPESSSTLGPEPGGEPLPPEANGRLAPPVTKGAPTLAEPSSQSSHLHDHDYFRQPSAIQDHDYFVRPPPGFTYPPQHGRPKRQSKLPTKFSDYELN